MHMILGRSTPEMTGSRGCCWMFYCDSFLTWRMLALCYLIDSFWVRVWGLPAAKQQPGRTSQRWRTGMCGLPAAGGWCRGTPGALGWPAGTGPGLTWNSPLQSTETETGVTAAGEGEGRTGHSEYFNASTLPPTPLLMPSLDHTNIGSICRISPAAWSSTGTACQRLCAPCWSTVILQTLLSAALCLPQLLLCLPATDFPSL